MNKSTELIKITMVAFEGISAFHLSVPCLVFQDIFFGQPVRFDLRICCENSLQFETSSGFGVVIDKDLSAIKEADIVIVPSWPNDLPEPSERLIEALIEHHGKGKLLVGLCLGLMYLHVLAFSMENVPQAIGRFPNNFSSNFLRWILTQTLYLLNMRLSLPLLE